MEIKAVINRNRDLSIILTIYSFLAIILITCFQYNVGGDGASYISIANYYATGNWNDAINAYWSPLYSWLLAPFLLSGFDPFQAVIISRALSLVIGFFTIIGVNQLAKTFEMDGLVKRAILISLLPIILFFALSRATPDLLVTCILVYYFSAIFNSNYPDKWSNGVSSGFIGGLGYLAKSYIFPFFIVHFSLFNLIHYLKMRKTSILKNFAWGLVVFFIISGLWVVTISQEYSKVTIGTATDYNHEIVGPQYQEHPIYFLGLIKPPNEKAVSIWEDPSTIKLKDWSPFESGEYFMFQLKLLWKNITRAIAFMEYFSLLSILILIVSLVIIFKTKSIKIRDNLIYLLTTILIYTGGYCLIFVEIRYLWPVCILLLVTGFYLIHSMYETRILNSKLRNIFLMILMVSFMVTPTYELVSYVSTDNQIPVLSDTLKNDYNIQGNIASNDMWAETLCISYYLGARYFGLTKNSNYPMEEELESNHIDYYFVWGADDGIILSNYKEITGNRIKNLRIYSRLN
ncbi:hypothetical protein [Methanobacterium sp.]|uniref:hypothetical protein n=1 Tax=Methanobacterium sp. TaxID=2164 RepID=UPI002ABC36C3|nr:hypothetical protein [Methanobacterium sp.]MDY9922814.1 hypothetical protein [Methanobacterium sp.]